MAAENDALMSLNNALVSSGRAIRKENRKLSDWDKTVAAVPK